MLTSLWYVYALVCRFDQYPGFLLRNVILETLPDTFRN